MSSIAGLAWNSTAPWYPVDESDALAKQAQTLAPTPGYDLVPGGATEQVGQRARRHAIRAPFESIIEFSDAQESQAVDITAGLASVNKSAIDDGRPSQVVEGQFEIGIESWSSSSLQRMCAYNPTAKLIPVRVLGLIGSDATEQAGQQLRYAIPGSFEDAVIEFSDAQESQAVDITAGFASVNKSVVYDGILSQVVEEQLGRLLSVAHEEQFEVGIESQLSGGLQRLCTYDPASVL